MQRLKISTIGDSLGIVFTQDMLAKLGVGEGDTLLVTETADGLTLTSSANAAGDQMAAMRDVMKKRRGALGDLSR